jgi:hypothetical protein
MNCLYFCDLLRKSYIGNVWQFGKLDSSQQQITQDINLFKVPGDIDSLVSVIIGILEGVNN